MKKISMMFLAGLVALQSLTFGTFAAETKTELYSENFDSYDLAEVYIFQASEKDTIKVLTEAAPGKETSDKALVIQRQAGTPAGRIELDTAADVYNQTDKNLTVEMSFEASVPNLETGVTKEGSKSINADCYLGTAEATAVSGLFGGVELNAKAVMDAEGNVSVQDWKFNFKKADGTAVVLKDGVKDEAMKLGMTQFKVQYVFRENGADKNVARVWIDGEQAGGDIPLGCAPGEQLSQAASFLVVNNISSSAPKLYIDNLTVSKIVSDDVTDPDPGTDPEPEENADMTPDLTKRGAGYLARNRFEDGLASGWNVESGISMMTDTETIGISKALRIEGDPSSEINGIIHVSPTGLLSKNVQSITDEGVSCNVVTEFDLYSDDVVQKGETAEIFLRNSKDSTHTPTVRITMDGAMQKLKFNKAGDVSCALADHTWYRVRIVHHATNSSGAEKKKYSIWVNGVQYIKEATYESTSAGKADYYDEFVLRIKNGSCTAGIDNFSIYRYNNAEGGNIGGAVDKSMLIVKLRSVPAKLAEAAGNIGPNEGQYQQEDYDKLVQAETDALKTYNDDTVNGDAVAAAVTALTSAYDALVPYAPNLRISEPAFYQGETETPMTDLNDSDILRTRIAFTVGTDPLENDKATLIVTLYENNSRTPLLVQAAMGTAALAAGETVYAEARLDLSGFTKEQRDNMMVNVMVWDDMNGMHPLMPCKSM